ncbi:hypothetical protein D3C85_1450310 [compost metagenome]
MYWPRSVVSPLYCWAPVVVTPCRSMVAPSMLRLARLLALPPSITSPSLATITACWPPPFSRPQTVTPPFSPLAVSVRLPPVSVALPVMSMAVPVRSPFSVTSPS